MSHTILRPFIVKVSILGYYPLYFSLIFNIILNTYIYMNYICIYCTIFQNTYNYIHIIVMFSINIIILNLNKLVIRFI